MKDDTFYIEQMLDAARKILTYTNGIDFEHFRENGEKQSAVILQLILIGELAKKLSDDFKSRIVMPWKQITGLRDRAVHDYYSLAIKDLWKTVENDIPVLKKTLEKAT